jgi:integrase
LLRQGHDTSTGGTALRRDFGTIRKLPSGRWQASYHHPRLGKRIGGPATWKAKADATAWLAAEETKLRRGAQTVDPRRGRIKFGSYADQWMAERVLRDRTREVYASQLRVHILPEFADVTLSGITPEHVRTWNASMVRSSPSMAPKAYRQLRTILTTAVEDGLLAENPCHVRGASQESSAERQIPTIDEVALLAEAIEPRFRCLVLIAAFCGLRKSECFGLARCHIRLDEPYPRVLVERQRLEVAGKGLVFAPLKTEAAARAVAIPQSVVGEIEVHLANYVGVDPEALLFTTVRSGDMPRASAWMRLWNKARTGAELEDVRFHDLRHLAGTLAAIAGGTMKELQARLGHASPDAAMRYQHVAQGRDAELASGIDRLIGG